MKDEIGVRRAKPCNEQCDVCNHSLSRSKHVEIETAGFLVRLCRRCATDVGNTLPAA